MSKTKSESDSKSNLVEIRQFALEECQFSIPQTAKHLGVSRSFVYGLIGTKKLRTVHLGKRVLIQGREIARFMRSLAA